MNVNKTYKIELTEEEARWLKAIMQNPLSVRYPQDEDKKEKRMRLIFWEALGGDDIQI